MRSENTFEYRSPLQVEEKKEEALVKAADSTSTIKVATIKTKKPDATKVLENNLSIIQKDDLIIEPVSSTAVEVPMEVTVHFLDITVPTAAISPYHLVYEELKGEPWKVLLASLLMKSVNSVTCRSMVLDFFYKFPNLESIQKDKLLDFFVVGSLSLGGVCRLINLVCRMLTVCR
jgi:hypothetical protein